MDPRINPVTNVGPISPALQSNPLPRDIRNTGNCCRIAGRDYIALSPAMATAPYLFDQLRCRAERDEVPVLLAPLVDPDALGPDLDLAGISERVALRDALVALGRAEDIEDAGPDVLDRLVTRQAPEGLDDHPVTS